MKKILVSTLTLIAGLFLLTAPCVLAQDICEGNFDCDQDVDGTDAAVFKEDFGRSAFKNPCPNCPPTTPVEKTWQWISYSPGDDGDYEHGAMWPNPRFTDNGNDTITDNLTGLMWLKNANCIATHYPGFDNDYTPGDGSVTWEHALDFIAWINNGSYTSCAGNPAYDDWRVPNVKELLSLLHFGFYNPAVPCTAGPCQWEEGDPFINVRSSFYWSSTTFADSTSLFAWTVSMSAGNMAYNPKTNSCFLWPVRGGQ